MLVQGDDRDRILACRLEALVQGQQALVVTGRGAHCHLQACEVFRCGDFGKVGAADQNLLHRLGEGGGEIHQFLPLRHDGQVGGGDIAQALDQTGDQPIRTDRDQDDVDLVGLLELVALVQILLEEGYGLKGEAVLAELVDEVEDAVEDHQDPDRAAFFHLVEVAGPGFQRLLDDGFVGGDFLGARCPVDLGQGRFPDEEQKRQSQCRALQFCQDLRLALPRHVRPFQSSSRARSVEPRRLRSVHRFCSECVMIARRFQPPSMSALIAFEAVACLQGFARAAAELNTSQPAVSRHLRHLEERLGGALLDRSVRQVRFARRDQTYYAAVLWALETLDGAAKTLWALGRRGNPGLYARGLTLLMPFYEELGRSLAPDVHIRILTSEYETIGATIDAGADITFVYGSSGKRGEQDAAVVQEAMMLLASPAFLAQHETCLSQSPEAWRDLLLLQAFQAERWLGQLGGLVRRSRRRAATAARAHLP